ncbi:hypothetical protein ACP4OV_029401 [Aristida adscensionis]
MEGSMIGLCVAASATVAVVAVAEARPGTRLALALCAAFHAGILLVIRGVRAAAGPRQP